MFRQEKMLLMLQGLFYLEEFQAAVNQMDGVVSWASFPGDAGLEAEQKLIDMRDQILNGVEDIETIMKETQDAINQILEK